MLADSLEAKMKALLDEVERDLFEMTWKAVPAPELLVHDKTVKVYEGRGTWVLTVTSFSIESQGFPPGYRSYDGAAVKDATVLRLTRELAKQAFAEAEKWCFLAGTYPT